MWNYNYQRTDELFHYGVPGMKWGRRKAIPVASGQAPKSKKQIRAEQTKAAVKKYSKKYDEASALSNIADKKWRDVKAEYKALGKTAISRILAAKSGKTAAAKAYNKHYNEASRMSDKADAAWRETKKLRKKTGRTKISRVINNARYS